MEGTEDPAVEADDAKKVDECVRLIHSNDTGLAESILKDVITRTPANYRMVVVADDQVAVRFWSLQAFMHAVAFLKTPQMQGTQLARTNIAWRPNAYGRAHYYLGFIGVARGRYAEALEVLCAGSRLERETVQFPLEIGHALMRMGRAAEALEAFSIPQQVGLFVTPADLAASFRGRGSANIELRQLDIAQAWYLASLKLEPSSVAERQLQYIEHLLAGGVAANSITTVVTADSPRHQAGQPGGELQIDDTGSSAKAVGRNDPCHCGSGKRYKHCHGSLA